MQPDRVKFAYDLWLEFDRVLSSFLVDLMLSSAKKHRIISAVQEFCYVFDDRPDGSLVPHISPIYPIKCQDDS
jgi:hypothetical protein